jgi:hypothetical protein
MKDDILQELSSSGHKLRIYSQDYTLIYHSNMERLKPLLEYLDQHGSEYTNIIVADRIMGNAAALLSIKAGCREVYSPLGSKIAEESFKQYGISYLFTTVVPYIAQPGTTTMCPMERLSLGKSPEEFFELVNTTAT